MTDPGRRRPRRDQAIEHAADLLRERGPQGLTSAAVAERMGITQPGVYRHVRNMDELTELAAERVVAGITESLHGIVFDESMDWDDIGDVDRLCRSLIDVAMANRQSFDVVTLWRFTDGPLGNGIRSVIDESCDLISALMESRWRIEFGFEGSLDDEQQLAQRAHAQAAYDDALAVVHIGFSDHHLELLDLDALATIFKNRLVSGWSAYVIDLNERTGLEYPRIDLVTGIVAE